MSDGAPTQLTLAFAHPPQYGRESFLPGGSNRAALALLDRWPEWPAPVVVLSGPAGSGKTHLAHIWAAQAGAGLLRAENLGHANAPGMVAGSGLAVDDVRPGDVPEPALFHLINSAKEQGAGLLITSRQPAAAWRLGLADLRSRLRMAAPAHLDAPDDDLLRQVLVKLFADRQLIVDRAVVDYLLVRMERSLDVAGSIVEALDREALARGAAITRPMAASVLAKAPDFARTFAEQK